MNSTDEAATVSAAQSMSLVMTVLNEEKTLPAFFASLAKQTIMPTEIVIVDGGSTDRTCEVIEEWMASSQISGVLKIHPGCSISEGRNSAIHLSSGKFIAITDGGTQLEPRWLEELVKVLDSGFDVASGFFTPAGERGMQYRIARIITPLLQEIDPDKFLPSSRSVASSRVALMDSGGYPEWLDYCEDLVLDLRLRGLGYRFGFAPDARVSWEARPSISKFFVQYFRYARGDAKAGLWPKRHALRLVTYAFAVLVAIAGFRKPALLLVLAIGALSQWFKYFKRALGHPGGSGIQKASAVLAVPLVVPVGDLAKLTGYWGTVVRSTVKHPKSLCGLSTTDSGSLGRRSVASDQR